VIVIFLMNLKSPDVARVPWQPLVKISILILLAATTAYVNRLPQFFLSYPTTTPLVVYYVLLCVSYLFLTAIYVAGAVLLLGFAWFFLERGFGSGCIPTWRRMPAAYFRDAFCVGLFGSAAMMGLARVPALFARWPLWQHSLGAAVPGNLDQLSPAAGMLASSLTAAFFAAGLLGLAAGLIGAYVRPAWIRAVLLLLFAVLMATNAATPGGFLREAAFQLVTITALWFGITKIARFNALGYFLLAAVNVLAASGVEFAEQPNPYFHLNGYAALLFAMAILAWPLLRWQRSR
jgi:hypothetical protein